MEFFFILGFWAGRSVEVSRDPFPPYTGELRNLHPEGIYILAILSSQYIYSYLWLSNNVPPPPPLFLQVLDNFT